MAPMVIAPVLGWVHGEPPSGHDRLMKKLVPSGTPAST
jgi:hypothetical protein